MPQLPVIPYGGMVSADAAAQLQAILDASTAAIVAATAQTTLAVTAASTIAASSSAIGAAAQSAQDVVNATAAAAQTNIAAKTAAFNAGVASAASNSAAATAQAAQAASSATQAVASASTAASGATVSQTAATASSGSATAAASSATAAMNAASAASQAASRATAAGTGGTGTGGTPNPITGAVAAPGALAAGTTFGVSNGTADQRATVAQIQALLGAAPVAGTGTTPVATVFGDVTGISWSIEQIAARVAVINGSGTATAYATAFTLALSAASGTAGTPVTLTFTPAAGSWPVGAVVTPSATSLTGAFSPTTLSPTGTGAVTCTFTPSGAAVGSLNATVSPTMTASSGPQTYTATAAAAAAGTRALVMSSTGTGNASSPDSATYSPNTLLDVRALINTPAYGGAGLNAVVAHFGSGGNGFILGLNAGSINAVLATSAASGGFINTTSSVVIPTAVNTDVWIRMVINLDTAAQAGVPATTLRFFTSPDDVTYTALGSDVTVPNAGPTAVAAGTLLTVGASGSIAAPNSIKVRRARVLTDTVLRFDADFSTQAASAANFTAASGQVVTVNAPAVIA